MRYAVLAAGFDGTLICEGRCEPRGIAALRALAASGRKLILTTSRQLRELLDIFPDARLFDYVVAENGAVVHRPSARESAILAPAPSELLIRELKRHRIEPISVGSVAVTTGAVHREKVAYLIEKLRLDCYLLDNGPTLTVLPVGVSKASGVQHALDDLGLSARNLVAVGDGQNDIALLQLAEHGVAVANSAPLLKQIADRVTRGAGSEGLDELIAELLDNGLLDAPTRRRIVLGRHIGQQDVSLPAVRCSVLLTGPEASGKAALCNGMLSQYLRSQYQCCIIGAYCSSRLVQEHAAHVITCGDEQTLPRYAEVVAKLENPDTSVVVNLVALRPSARAAYAEQLLNQLAGLQACVGRPHVVVFDQAESMLSVGSIARCTAGHGASRIYLSSQFERLPQALLDSVEVVVALGGGSYAPSHVRGATTAATSVTDAQACEPGQACVWFRDSGSAPFRMELDPQSTRLRIVPELAGIGFERTTRSSRIERDVTVAPS